jgi:hypothetical protein
MHSSGDRSYFWQRYMPQNAFGEWAELWVKDSAQGDSCGWIDTSEQDHDQR